MTSYRVIFATPNSVMCTQGKLELSVYQVEVKRRSLPHLLLPIGFVLLHWLLLLRPVRIRIMIRVLPGIVPAFPASVTASCAWSRVALFVFVGSMVALICYRLLLVLRALCWLLLLFLLL